MENSHLFLNNSSVSEVLYAAAWICGEFAEYALLIIVLAIRLIILNCSQIPSPKSTLLHLLTTNAFPAHITAVFLQNASKILAKMSREKNEEFFQLSDELVGKHLPHFLTNEDLEVQERASSLLQIIQIIKSENLDAEQMFFAYSLNPVAAKAQRKVPVPAGLELEQPFVELDDSDSEDEKIEEMTFVDEEEEEEIELTEEQIKKNIRTSEERKAQMEKNPNYLKSRSKKKKAAKRMKDFEMAAQLAEEAEEVIVNNVNPVTNNAIPGLISSQNFMKKTKQKKKSKKKSKKNEEEEEEPEVQHTVTIKGLEMPEGAELNDMDDSDDEMNVNASEDPHRALAKITFNEADFAFAMNAQKQSKRLDSNLLEDRKKTKKTPKKVKTIEDKEEKKKKKKTKTEDITNENKLVITQTNENSVEVTGAKKKSKKADRPKNLELNGEKKKKKKTKLKSSTVLEPTEPTESERKRDEYEETAGIETPSLFVPLMPSTHSEATEPADSVVATLPSETTTDN